MPEITPNTLALNMKRMRRATKTTQSALEKMTGCPSGTVSSIERGKRRASMELLQEFCRILNWPISELLQDSQIENK